MPLGPSAPCKNRPRNDYYVSSGTLNPTHSHSLRVGSHSLVWGDIIQMTHDGECNMLIYMSQSWNVNTRAKPKFWYFSGGTYIFACHTSPSCIICFVTSLTKMWLNCKSLHFTDAQWYDNYITTGAASVKPRLPRRLSQWARVGFVYIQCRDVDNPVSHRDIERKQIHWLSKAVQWNIWL